VALSAVLWPIRRNPQPKVHSRFAEALFFGYVRSRRSAVGLHLSEDAVLAKRVAWIGAIAPIHAIAAMHR
jgi:hypothetical protein